MWCSSIRQRGLLLRAACPSYRFSRIDAHRCTKKVTAVTALKPPSRSNATHNCRRRLRCCCCCCLLGVLLLLLLQLPCQNLHLPSKPGSLRPGDGTAAAAAASFPAAAAAAAADAFPAAAAASFPAAAAATALSAAAGCLLSRTGCVDGLSHNTPTPQATNTHTQSNTPALSPTTCLILLHSLPRCHHPLAQPAALPPPTYAVTCLRLF